MPHPVRGDAMTDDMRRLTVLDRAEIARGIHRFTLTGPDLPHAAPGDHVMLRTPVGMTRQYSLCGPPGPNWQIAVKREAAGRGGSASLIDTTEPGDTLDVSGPISGFPLLPAKGYLFIAGGIGITPILSMLRHLADTGDATPWRLVYCTRDTAGTAFADTLAAPPFGPRVTLHHDNGEPGRAFDFWPLLEAQKGRHLYCCGPRGLMDTVRDQSGHWSQSALHFEDFGSAAVPRADDVPFTVRLARSFRVVDVPVGISMLEAVRAAGASVPSSCESGTCGTCRTGLLAGDADHRDQVLTEAERATHIMLCVSRARGGELVLDL